MIVTIVFILTNDSSPLLIVSGLIYLLIKHLTDCYLLIMVNRAEIDSDGQIEQSMVNLLYLSLVLVIAIQILK